jgi:hypothetical protein
VLALTISLAARTPSGERQPPISKEELLNNTTLPTVSAGDFLLSFEEAGVRLDRSETSPSPGSPARAQTPPPGPVLGRAEALSVARALRPGASPGIAFVGPAGSGKSTLLALLGSDPVLRERFDVFVSVRVASQPWEDVLAQIFRALHTGSEPPMLPVSNEWTSELHNKRVGLTLDDADAPFDLEALLRRIPQALVFATATTPLPALSTFPLTPLTDKDAGWLLEVAHPLSWGDREAARALTAAAAGNPLRVKQLAALAASKPTPELGRTVTSPLALENFLRTSSARLDARQRGLLDAIGIFGSAAVENDDPGARKLATEGLVVADTQGWRIAPELASRYAAPDESVFRGALNSCSPTLTGTIATTNDPSILQPVVAATKRAGELDRFGEVVDLGKLTGNALARCGAWNQWRTMLDFVSAAAGRMGADSVQSWVLHQSGTRFALLGQTADAQSMLRAALARRKAAKDIPAAKLSEHNLGIISGGAGRSQLVTGGVAVAAAAAVLLGLGFVLRPHAPPAVAERPAAVATVHVASARPAHERAPAPKRQVVAVAPRPIQAPTARPLPSAKPTARPAPSARPSGAPARAAARPNNKARAQAQPRTVAVAAGEQHYTKPEILAFDAARTLLTAGGTTHLCMSVRAASRVRLTATSQAQTREVAVPAAVREGKPACIRIAPKAATRYALHASSGPNQAFRILAIDVFQAPEPAAGEATAAP